MKGETVTFVSLGLDSQVGTKNPEHRAEVVRIVEGYGLHGSDGNFFLTDDDAGAYLFNLLKAGYRVEFLPRGVEPEPAADILFRDNLCFGEKTNTADAEAAALATALVSFRRANEAYERAHEALRKMAVKTGLLVALENL